MYVPGLFRDSMRLNQREGFRLFLVSGLGFQGDAILFLGAPHSVSNLKIPPPPPPQPNPPLLLYPLRTIIKTYEQKDKIIPRETLG